MVRRLERRLAAAGIVAVLVACTTYSEEPPAEEKLPVDDAGSTPDVKDPSDVDGEAPPPPPPDASDDAKSPYNEACPPCSAGKTCVAAGCQGDGVTNSCAKPFDVTAPMSVIAFVCPEGPTVDLPQPCVPETGTKNLHVAVFRMGTSPGNGGNWRVSVSGSNSFVSSGGDCATVNSCAGGTSGPSQPRSVEAGEVAKIGTTNKLDACQQVMIEFDKD